MSGEWQSASRNPGEVSPRQTKYVDSFAFEHANFAFEHANAGTPLGKESLHCKTQLSKGIAKSYHTLALHGLAPFPLTSNPKRHKRIDTQRTTMT